MADRPSPFSYRKHRGSTKDSISAHIDRLGRDGVLFGMRVGAAVLTGKLGPGGRGGCCSGSGASPDAAPGCPSREHHTPPTRSPLPPAERVPTAPPALQVASSTRQLCCFRWVHDCGASPRRSSSDFYSLFSYNLEVSLNEFFIFTESSPAPAGPPSPLSDHPAKGEIGLPAPPS